MLKKIVLTVMNTFSVLAIVLALAILLCVVATPSGSVPNIMGFTMLRVLTGSMKPTIPVDSLLIVKRVDPTEIQIGDVISFYSADPELRGAVNTHRVTGIEQDGDSIVFRTRGDASHVDDAYGVKGQYLIGKVIFSTVILGKAVRLVSNPIVFIPLILIPMVVILSGNLIRTVSIVKNLSREEEEAAREEFREMLRKRQEAAESEDSEK